jgi:hypothetical protein
VRFALASFVLRLPIGRLSRAANTARCTPRSRC